MVDSIFKLPEMVVLPDLFLVLLEVGEMVQALQAVVLLDSQELME